MLAGHRFNAIARASAGASGAELANMVNEAALLAVKDGRKAIVQKDLEEAIETVIAGYQKKGKVISNREKLIVSYHEIGHALVAALSKGSGAGTQDHDRSAYQRGTLAIPCRWRKMSIT